MVKTYHKTGSHYSYRRQGVSQGQSGQVRKISPPPRFDSRLIQTVAIPTELSQPTTVNISNEHKGVIYKIRSTRGSGGGGGEKLGEIRVSIN